MPNQLFQCNHCQKAFSSQPGLLGHLQSHKVSKSIEMKPCAVCGTSFDSLIRRRNGQYVRKETCSRSCSTKLRIQRGTATKKPDVIAMAKAVHGDKFDYSRIVYVDAKTPITVGCPVHGFFQIGFHSHIGSKYGCPSCGLEIRNQKNTEIGKDKRLSIDEILRRFKTIHGDVYQYPYIENEFKGIGWSFPKITIVCSKHGEFKQHPSDHASGTGCPSCSKWVSHKERAWLNSLGLPDDSDHRQVWIEGHPVDGYDPTIKTIYMFHGSFWHGNPAVYKPDDINPMLGKTFGSLYERTLAIEHQLRDKGYTVISKWEH
jgi:hypothetical protein